MGVQIVQITLGLFFYVKKKNLFEKIIIMNYLSAKLVSK